MPSKSNLLIRASILFIALFALLVGYYWVHKPFDAVVALRVGGALLDVLTAGVLFGIGGGIGRAALARIDLSGLSRAEQIALEAGIGVGLVALAVLIFGLVGLYRPLILWGLLLVAAVLLRRSLIGWLRDARAVWHSALQVESTGQGLIVFYCAIMLALALLLAVAPPFHWDSLTYHLVAPERYLHAGAITAQPDNFYLGLSQNVEMLYGLAMGLFGRDTAAAPVHFGLGLIAVLAAAGVTRRYAGRSAGRWAALLLLSAYNLWALFGWAYADLGTLAYGALAITAATMWRERKDSRASFGWLVVMGAVVGLATGVKYTAGTLGIVLGLFVLIHQPRRVVHNGIVLVIAALIAFAPWAIKGLLRYHNPVYPFAFNGLNWNAERMAAFNFADYSLIARGDGWQLPVLPVAATIFGQDGVDGFGFTTGPWLLTAFLLLPLVWPFLEERARRLALDTLALILPLLVFWGGMAAANSVGIQTRLMVMGLPAFAVAGAVGLHGLASFPKKPFDINFIARGVVALALALTVLDAVWTVTHDQVLPYLLGLESLPEYMYTNTGAYYNAMTHLPPHSRVLLMWEPRGYYCPPTVTCQADVLFDLWKQPVLDQGLTPDEVFQRYKDQGDDYLLVFQSMYDQYLGFSRHPDLDKEFPAALDRWMTPVWTDGVRFTLYGWKKQGGS